MSLDRCFRAITSAAASGGFFLLFFFGGYPSKTIAPDAAFHCLQGDRHMNNIAIAPPLDRLESHLLTWADWMRTGGCVDRKFPNNAAGFTAYGINSFDEIEDSANTFIATVIDAIVQDLPRRERNAINHEYLHSRYMYASEFFSDALKNAKCIVQDGINRKGLW